MADAGTTMRSMRFLWCGRGVLAAVASLGLAACASDGRDGNVVDTGVPDSGTTSGPGEPTATQSSSAATDSVSETTAPGDGPIFDVGMGESTGGGACVPTSDAEVTCDGIDDDCNGIIDEVDAGNDGICDCLGIAIIGVPGELAASQFEQWLLNQGTSAERINPALIDAAVLDKYDIVILDQLTREYSAAEAVAFEAWVNANGGLMALTGHSDSPVSAQAWPNGILGTFGMEYQGTLLHGPVNDFLPHPITAGVNSITFIGGFTVVETIAGATDVVGQLPGPIPMARAREYGAGKVFAWGDEWIEYDSEWIALPEVSLLWANILSWLAPVNFCALPEG